jgi:hypothetical protein
LNFRQLNGPGSHATYLARIQVRYKIRIMWWCTLILCFNLKSLKVSRERNCNI